MLNFRQTPKVLLYILYLFVLQELLFRLLFPLPEVKNFNRTQFMYGGQGEGRSRAIRNTRVISGSSPDGAEFIHTVNLYGFRDINWSLSRDPDRLRVAIIGDSFVEGCMSADRDTVPNGFSRAAGENRIVLEAMNFGIAGGNLASYIALSGTVGRLFRPDWLVMVVYANDLPCELNHPLFDTAFTPEYYSVWKPRFLELLRMAKNHEMLPFRWHLGEYRFDHPVPHPDNPWSDPVFEIVNRHLVSDRILTACKNGTFNPWRLGGSSYVAQALLTPFDYSRDFQKLKEYLSALGIKLLMAYIPERGQVTNYYKKFEQEYSVGIVDTYDLTGPRYQLHQQLLSRQLMQAGIPFLDMTNVIRKQEAAGNHLYWDYDDHMRGTSNYLVGQAMFAFWNSVRQ